MAYHGQVLDTGFDPSKENIYELFTQYFNNPVMTKIKDIDQFSMYMTKIHAILGIEFRFLIVFIFHDIVPIGNQEKLQNLKWISLQTRTLKEDKNLSHHSYVPRRLADLDKKITLIKQDTRQYIYQVENMPLIITLLPKTKGLDYTSSGSVVSALETYQTIVNFI